MKSMNIANARWRTALAVSAGAAWLAATSAWAQAPAPAPGAPPATTPAVTPVTPPAAPGGTTPIAATLSTPSPALPQPSPNLQSSAAFPDRRGFVRTEPFFIYPWVGLGFGHNDNLAGTSANKISSSFWVLSPRLQAEAKGGGHTHTLSYLGNYGRYASSSADNYNDHELALSSVNQFTARADLTGSVYYLDKVDPRGLLARAFSATPDEWRAFGANGTFGYGARSAQGRLEFDLGVSDKEYKNNRAVTEAFDVSTVGGAARFLYRIAPRTRLLAELRATQFDYKAGASFVNRDNTELRYLVGATWDLAAATSGTVKMGYMSKDFKQPGLQDFRGANFDAILRWAPRTYSYIDILARRGAVDSLGTGIYTVDNTFGATWNHRWMQYVSTRALITHTSSDFQGLARTDKLSTLSFGGYFDIRTWLRFGAEITHQKRGSTDSTVEFSRNVLLFTVAATL